MENDLIHQQLKGFEHSRQNENSSQRIQIQPRSANQKPTSNSITKNSSDKLEKIT